MSFKNEKYFENFNFGDLFKKSKIDLFRYFSNFAITLGYFRIYSVNTIRINISALKILFNSFRRWFLEFFEIAENKLFFLSKTRKTYLLLPLFDDFSISEILERFSRDTYTSIIRLTENSFGIS